MINVRPYYYVGTDDARTGKNIFLWDSPLDGNPVMCLIPTKVQEVVSDFYRPISENDFRSNSIERDVEERTNLKFT